MQSIQLVKFTIRTGTEAQRRRVVLEQGELAYITDIKRVVVGDGVLSGGSAVGARIHNPLQTIGSRITLGNAYYGDVVWEAGLMWQLTGTDPTTATAWSRISAQVDESTLTYDASNNLIIKNNGITGTKFAASAGSGGIVATVANGLSANPDYVTLGVTSNQLHLLDNGVTENHIINSSFTQGITGGSSEKIRLDVDRGNFYFTGNTLAISSIPTGIVKFNTLDSSWVGAGLTYDAGLSAIKSNVLGALAPLSSINGYVTLLEATVGGTTPLATITYDNYGRVITTKSSVATTFAMSAKSASPGFAYLSAFNGYPGQSTQGSLSDIPLTMFQVLSTNATATEMITLSSAGFVALPASLTQDGKTCDRFVVPVFSY